jgi:hypothetical protein
MKRLKTMQGGAFYFLVYSAEAQQPPCREIFLDREDALAAARSSNAAAVSLYQTYASGDEELTFSRTVFVETVRNAPIAIE